MLYEVELPEDLTYKAALSVRKILLANFDKKDYRIERYTIYFATNVDVLKFYMLREDKW